MLVLLFAGLAASGSAGNGQPDPDPRQNSLKSQTMPETRQAMDGMIIIKFKNHISASFNGPVTSLPSIDARITRYQGYRLEPAFDYLKNIPVEGLDRLAGIHYFYYHSGHRPAEVAADFAADPAVTYAEPKYIYPLLEIPNDPQYSAMTQFPFMRADTAWGIVKGEQGDVVIAIVDGGTDWDHEDLLANAWVNPGEIPGNGIDDDNNGFIDDIHGWNFSNSTNDPTGNPATPTSAAHGTHTAGTAAGVTNNGIGVASISWNSQLMSLNAAHPTSDRSISYGYEAMTYAAANGADIINCSWGGTGAPSSFEQEVINFAYTNGVLVVAAAGNNNVNNDNTPHYPSNYHRVLAVGATNKTNDTKASFSNYGATVDVFAAGVSILSTTPNNGYQSSSWSGTSMASPLAAGLAALVKTQNPGWTVDQVREQVRVTSDNIDGVNPSYTGLLGKGRVNALRAVTEFTHPAIRLVDKSFVDSGGNGIINAGEVVAVTLKFTNYLSSALNITITLTENDPNITVTAGTANIPSLVTNDTAEVNYQFNVAPGVEDGYVLRFHTNIAASGYTDRDFFQLVVNPPQFVAHHTGPLETAITTQGNIGWTGFQGQSSGIGFVFNGQDYLFEGGLMIGTGINTVSDCIRGTDGSTQDDDFRPASGEILSVITPGQYTFEQGSILMVDSLATTPLGISVLQTTYADTLEGFNDYVIFKYEIVNPTPLAISNMYVGLFFDWDIAAAAADYVRYDATRRLGYVQNSSSNATHLAATKLLTTGSGVSFRAVHNPNEIYDGFTPTEKWNFLSGGLQTQSLNGVDVSTLLSEGPFTIPSEASIEMAFAVIGGNSLAELETNADNAQNFWDNPSLDIPQQSQAIPDRFILEQNFPNPFNPETRIGYQIPAAAEVNIQIFNILGQEIRTVVDGHQAAGSYSVMWDGRDAAGQVVPSGVYLYRLTAGEFTAVRKMILMR